MSGCLVALFSTLLEILTGAIRQEEETKGIQIGYEDVKLSPCADDVLFCIENLTENY